MGEKINQILEFLHMGGYGLYIWPCYLIFILVFSWHLYAALKTAVNIKKKILLDRQESE